MRKRATKQIRGLRAYWRKRNAALSSEVRAKRKYDALKGARYRARHPDRASASQKRFHATPKGKLYKWSNTAAARCRKTSVRRGDGRIKKTIGGTITAAELRSLWREQDGRCVLTDRKMILRNGIQSLDSPTVDRVDTSLGYHIDNVRLVIYQANCARLFGSDARLRSFCKWVLDHTRK